MRFLQSGLKKYGALASVVGFGTFGSARYGLPACDEAVTAPALPKAPFGASTYPANNPTEDQHVTFKSNQWDVFGVLDGHGGWQVSKLASKTLPFAIAEQLESSDAKDAVSIDKLVTESFLEFDNSYANNVRQPYAMGYGAVASVGSCVLLAFRNAPMNKLIIANLGDCQAVLGSKSDTSPQYIGQAVTNEHNARIPAEKALLEKEHPNEANIVVCKNPHACYVKGRLQLTGALGDLYLKRAEFNAPAKGHRSSGRHIPPPYTPPYVRNKPDIHHIEVGPKDKFIILASDGLWDYLTPQDAVDVVTKHYQEAVTQKGWTTLFGLLGGGDTALVESSSQKASDALVHKALEVAAAECGMTVDQLKEVPVGSGRRRLHDDTTVVVFYL